MRRKALLIVVLTISLSANAGSGWVKKKGETYLKLNQFWVQSDRGYFDANGVFDPLRRSSLFTTSLYGESGLGERWSMEFFVPIYTRHTLTTLDEMGNEVSKDAIGGIGDVNFGLKQSIVNNSNFAFSATYTIGLPLGVTGGGEDATLFTGDGELNAMLRLDAGVPFGFGKVGGYFNLNAGYNLRSQIFSDEFLFGTELGISVFESKLWLIGRIIGIEATQSGTNADGNVFASNVNFVNYSVEANLYLNERLGISSNYTGNVSGSTVLISPAYNVGFFYDIK